MSECTVKLLMKCGKLWLVWFSEIGKIRWRSSKRTLWVGRSTSASTEGKAAPLKLSWRRQSTHRWSLHIAINLSVMLLLRASCSSTCCAPQVLVSLSSTRDTKFEVDVQVADFSALFFNICHGTQSIKWGYQLSCRAPPTSSCTSHPILPSRVPSRWFVIQIYLYIYI